MSFQPESSFKKQEETDNLRHPARRLPPAKTKQVAEENKARVQEFKDSAQLKEPQSPSKPEEQHKPIAGNQLAAPGAAHSQDQIRSPATLSPAPLQGKSSAASEAAAPRLEQSSPPEVHPRKDLAPSTTQKRKMLKGAAAQKAIAFGSTRKKRSSSLSALRSSAWRTPR